jgi:lambda repressor-like predicted transcriptional regulator
MNALASKKLLRKKGWSWRRAAQSLGCSYTHLAHTLTGRRQSRILLRRIAALPVSPVKYRVGGFASRRKFQLNQKKAK